MTEFRNAVPGSVIESYPSPRDALPHVSDADAIAMWGFQNVQPFLEASPHVRWIHSLSDGVERLLTKDMLKRPIILTNSHGIHDHAVADHTLALLLSLVRCLPIMIRQQDQKFGNGRKRIPFTKRLLPSLVMAASEKQSPNG